MIRLFYYFIAISLLFISGTVSAQGGAIDSSFNALDVGFGFGDGADNYVTETAIQPDGKTIIAGNFTKYNGTARSQLARLNVDGSLDTSFDPGTSTNNFIQALSVQADGKIIIAGYFTSYNGTARNGIARLEPDGSVDPSFDPGAGSGGSGILSTSIQSDGKIIIGGYFTFFNGSPRNRIARLNTDGSVDGTFLPGTGANNAIVSTVIQPDGKIVIGGHFLMFDGNVRDRIARLNSDGSLDLGFDPGTGANAMVNSLKIQTDGKIVIGGYFTNFNGAAINYVARLNTNGSLDTGFNTGTGASSIVYCLGIQSDGKIIVGGNYYSFNGTSTSAGLVRLNTNGSVDLSFNVTASTNDIHTIAVQSDDKVIIGGPFSEINGRLQYGVVRLNVAGTFDTNFGVGTSVDGYIYSTAIQSDGKIIIGGQFTSYNNIARNKIARLNTDGNLDISFDPGIGANGVVQSIAIQSDGRIIIGGIFTNYNGTAVGGIVRLNSNGSIDPTFNTGTGASGGVTEICIQPDGKVIVAGGFTAFNGLLLNRITRLNTNGSWDGSFYIGSGVDNTINSIAIQSDGKILLGGYFTYYDGTPRNRIARLNTDGSLDSGFDPGTGVDNAVESISIQADGKAIICGYFVTYNTVSRNRIARVNTDGSLDTSFNPGTGANAWMSSAAIQSDGKILIGGSFTNYNGTVISNFARLIANGSLDPNFVSGTGPGAFVGNVTIQSDDKMILTGNFTNYNGIGRNRIARILDANCFSNFVTTYDSTLNAFTLTVDPTTTATAVSYNWDFGDGTTSTLSTPSHFYAIDSLYNVCMKIFTATGDSCTYCNIIGIDSSGTVIRTGGFTLNVQGSSIITGVGPADMQELVSVYPNPNNGIFSVSFSEPVGNTSIEVFNSIGALVLKQKVANQKCVVDLGTQAKGLYLVKIISDNEILGVKKVVLE